MNDFSLLGIKVLLLFLQVLDKNHLLQILFLFELQSFGSFYLFPYQKHLNQTPLSFD